MSRRPAPVAQMTLLDWQPPEPVARFEDAQVRATSIAEQVSRAISVALSDCPRPREEVAAAMSAYLGQPVSMAMLNAYASQAREMHNISVVRLIALLHATQDRRLLEMVAGLFGWAVIERRYLPLITVAQLQDKEDELRRQRQLLTRAARIEGVL